MDCIKMEESTLPRWLQAELVPYSDLGDCVQIVWNGNVRLTAWIEGDKQ